MAEVEWVKLYTKMFESPKVKKIRRLPEGNNIILMWVMLLVLAGKCNAGGVISITESEPYDIDSLADELRFEIPVVTLAIRELAKYGMIETGELTDGIFLKVKNWEEYQNIDGLERIREGTRKRVANYRERQKLLQQNNDDVTCNVTVTPCNAIEEDKDKELRIENKNNNTKGVFQEFAGDDKELLNALKEFDKMRKMIKSPLTDGAKSRLLSRLQAFPREDWIKILNQSCNNNWKDIYELKGADNNGRKQSVHSDVQKSSGDVQDTKPKWNFHYDNDP